MHDITTKTRSNLFVLDLSNQIYQVWTSRHNTAVFEKKIPKFRKCEKMSRDVIGEIDHVQFLVYFLEFYLNLNNEIFDEIFDENILGKIFLVI